MVLQFACHKNRIDALFQSADRFQSDAPLFGKHFEQILWDKLF